MLHHLCRIAVLGAALAAASVSHAQLISGGSSSGSGATPGGSSGQLQFNNANTFGGGAGTAWDDTNRALTISGATVTSSKPLLDLSQTWNAGGVEFSALKLNVTDTASASGSTLLDLQVGGVSKVKADKAGNLTVYNTYIDASNYEVGFLKWTTNVFQVGTGKAGTGVARVLDLNAQGNVTFSPGGSTVWRFDSSTGSLLAQADNTYSIGANGANRPYRIYVANRVYTDDLVIPANGVWANSDTASFTAGVSQDAWIKRIGAGIFRIQNNSSTAGVLVTAATTVSGLPAAATAGAGARGYVTDATSCTFLGALTGGGSTKCPVVSDGTSWTGG